MHCVCLSKNTNKRKASISLAMDLSQISIVNAEYLLVTTRNQPYRYSRFNTFLFTARKSRTKEHRKTKGFVLV